MNDTKPIIINSSGMNKPKVLIHCQYVYGIGHLVRALQVAEGLCTHFEVFLLNGGEVVPNFQLPPVIKCIQLPAIYKMETADFLTPVEPNQSLDECFRLREKIIGSTVEHIKPAILITEHFPFGLLFEDEVLALISLVKKVNPDAKIVCSVRDVIESGKGGTKDQYVCELLNKLYDLVLVHGDVDIIPFSSSFPLAIEISIPIYQTGYVVDPILNPNPDIEKPLLVVSVGGGRLGDELLSAVLDAHEAILEKWDHHLVLFTGAFQKDSSSLRERVLHEGLKQVTICTFDKKVYRQTVSKASVIICLGGYNSLIEAVSTQKPVLVYKREFHGANKEQDLRSTLFQHAGYINIIYPDDLVRPRLAELILDAAVNFQRPNRTINLEGVATSLQILTQLKNR